MIHDGHSPGGPSSGGGDDQEGPTGHETPGERHRRLAALLAVEIGATTPQHADHVTPAGDPAGPANETASRERRPGGGEGDVGQNPDDADGSVGPVPSQTSFDAPSWRAVVSFAVLFALIVGGVGLSYAGTRVIRSSTEGEVFTPVRDPTAPGFEALVDPTPTLALLHDRDGVLDAVTVLTLPDPDNGGGGVLLIPDRTVADLGALGELPIEAAYDLGDARFEAQAVGDLLGAAMNDFEVIDAERWADLVEPVAPIVIDNPNELTFDGEVRFPIGEIELGPEDVGAYLEADDAEGSDLARLARHETFWREWLEAVAAEGSPAAVPGELDSGIGRFVRAIAEGPAVIETLPVQPAPDGGYGPETAFLPVHDEIDELVARLVPFPVSPSPGARARLRLQNGTTDTSVAASVAAELPPAGVQVVLIGNASTLDHETTTVRYGADEFADEARAVVDILGVGEAVQGSRPSDAADITVTLGADYG